MALVGHWTLTEDSLFLGTELVTNGNMELDSDWDNQASPAANVRSDEQAHSGIYSRKITLNGIGSFGGICSADAITFVVGKSYIVTGWAYNLNMSNGERLVMDCTQFSAGAFSIYPNQGVWAQWSEVVVATESSGKILLYNYPTDVANANASFYVDDVSIKEIYFEDDSGNGNNGMPANDPVFTTNQQARADRALTLNGTTDKVDCGGDASVKPAAWSILGWVKFTDGTFTPFTSWNSTASVLYLTYVDIRATIIMGAANFCYIHWSNAGFTLNDGNWHHVAITIPGSGQNDIDDMRMYIDNVLVPIAYYTVIKTGAQQAKSNFLIGNVATRWNDGDECNIRLYNHVVSEAVRTNIYNSELFWHTELITGQMDFAGSLSAQNPKWLLLDKSLNWIGEWDESYSYNINDTILYKIDDGNEWHIFVSKTNHNVGNVPTTSAAYWRRYYQEQLL